MAGLEVWKFGNHNSDVAYWKLTIRFMVIQWGNLCILYRALLYSYVMETRQMHTFQIYPYNKTN